MILHVCAGSLEALLTDASWWTSLRFGVNWTREAGVHPSTEVALLPDRGETQWRGLPQPDSSEFNTCISIIRRHLTMFTPMQAAVALGLWGGLKEREIAEWLERSESTVHQHVQQGAERLGERGEVRRADLILEVERALAADRTEDRSSPSE